MKKTTIKFHHTSMSRGYVSKKAIEGIKEEYNGRFGKGYTIKTNNPNSTRYCFISYYTEVEEEVDYNGVTWGSITEEERTALLKNASIIDAESGNEFTKESGECTIDLAYGYSIAGKLVDGEIVIGAESIIYNPVQ